MIDMTHKELFPHVWREFVDSFRGSLIRQSQRQRLTFHLVSFMLENAKMLFLDRNDVCGSWLSALERTSPDCADAVQNTIDTYTLTEEKGFAPLNRRIEAVSAVAAGAVGYGVARICALSIVGTAGVTVGAAAVVYPLASRVVNNANRKRLVALIDAYVRQLEPLKGEITGLISSLEWKDAASAKKEGM